MTVSLSKTGEWSYSGPARLDGYEVDAHLTAQGEPVEAGVDPYGLHVVSMPLYSWRGTLQLHDLSRAVDLAAGWPSDGRRTLTLPDGRAGEAVQTLVDSEGRVEIEGIGPAPWWMEAAA